MDLSQSLFDFIIFLLVEKVIVGIRLLEGKEEE
jgi:hypothetical protein